MSFRNLQPVGITSSRRISVAIAGSALWMSTGAHAAEAAPPETAPAAEAAVVEGGSGEAIVVQADRYRINTLNSRLPDVRDAPQSISIIPRDIIEKQAAT